MAAKRKKRRHKKQKPANTELRNFVLLSGFTLFLCLFLPLYKLNKTIDNKPLSDCGTALPARSFPLSLASAVIAQEDHGFLSHRGVNWREAKQALLVNLQAGRVAYGASTLDMQVASLCYLKEKKLNRWIEKPLEIILAYLLTRRYEKQEILRAYLSVAPFAAGIRGFEAASMHYFQKPLMKLSFNEEWSLVLALRNKDTLNPEATEVTRKLPKKIRRQWLAAQWRQNQTLRWQAKKLLLFPYIRNKRFD